MKLQRTLGIAAAAVTLGAAGTALAGSPNPTESQDPYWDLKDQAAAWREHHLEKARAEARKAGEKAPQPAPVAAPVADRPAKG
jgi:hypothetical protein